MLHYILYRIGQFIALTIPLKISYFLAVLISDLHYLFAREDRANVMINLKEIFPEKTTKELRSIKLRMFRNFAKYLVDFFRFTALDMEYVKKNVKIVNKHFLDEAFEKKKGIIILSAHMGNWELGGVTLAMLGYPFWAVALPHKTKKEDDFFNKQRESKGVKVIPMGKAFIKCLNLLKENNLIALVGDKDFSRDGGILVDFFSKPTLLPLGPAALALKTGAVILPSFLLRNADDTFTLKFEKGIETGSAAQNNGNNLSSLRNLRNEEIKKLTREYKTVIEDYIREYPEQWYMFKKFWIEE